MRRGAIIGLSVAAIVLAGVVVVYDTLMAGLERKAHINEGGSIARIVEASYGSTPPTGLSCFTSRRPIDSWSRDPTLSCADNTIASHGLDWGTSAVRRCNPVSVLGGLRRESGLPFTPQRFTFVLFAEGKDGGEVRRLLDAARALPSAEYEARYTLNPGGNGFSESNFYYDPSPTVLSSDCEGYSITRLEYSLVKSYTPRE